jgi:hypothetical protein
VLDGNVVIDVLLAVAERETEQVGACAGIRE